MIACGHQQALFRERDELWYKAQTCQSQRGRRQVLVSEYYKTREILNNYASKLNQIEWRAPRLTSADLPVRLIQARLNGKRNAINNLYEDLVYISSQIETISTHIFDLNEQETISKLEMKLIQRQIDAFENDCKKLMEKVSQQVNKYLVDYKNSLELHKAVKKAIIIPKNDEEFCLNANRVKETKTYDKMSKSLIVMSRSACWTFVIIIELLKQKAEAVES